MSASTQRRSSLLAFLRSIGAKALRGGLAKNRPFCVHKTRRLLRKSRRVFLKGGGFWMKGTAFYKGTFSLSQMNNAKLV